MKFFAYLISWIAPSLGRKSRIVFRPLLPKELLDKLTDEEKMLHQHCFWTIVHVLTQITFGLESGIYGALQNLL